MTTMYGVHVEQQRLLKIKKSFRSVNAVKNSLLDNTFSMFKIVLIHFNHSSLISIIRGNTGRYDILLYSNVGNHYFITEL